MATMTREEAHERELRLQAAAIDTLLSAQGIQAWIAARRHHRSRSVRNQLLIVAQMPQARFAFTFRQWLRHGYCVSKGEKASYIWQPKGRRTTDGRLIKPSDPTPNEPTRQFFGLAAVFGEHQVAPLEEFDGERLDLQGLAEPLDVTGEQCAIHIGPLTAFAADRGFTLTYPSDECGRAGGFFRPATLEIHVRAHGHANADFRTLVHELCHGLLHAHERFENITLSYAAEEMVVETATRLACASVGLDLAFISDAYAAWWAASGDLSAAELTAHATTIDRLARMIEDVLHLTEDPLS